MMIKESLRKIDYMKWGAVFFSLSFSLGIAINSICFVLFLFVGVVMTCRDMIWRKMTFGVKKANLILASFFLIIIIRELTIDYNEGFSIAYYYLAFILLPIIIFFQAKNLKKHIPIILKVFMLGCFFNAMINISYAIYRGILIREEGINFWYFTYNFFSEPFGIQPIYLAFFYVFSLFILNHFNAFIKNRFFYYTVFSVLTLGVFLLAARNAIACLIILVPIYLILEKRLKYKGILIAIGLFGIFFLIAIQNPVIKNRILKIHKKGNFYSGTSLRASIWESAYRASKENFIWGSGEKKANSLLLKDYKQKELTIPVKYNYNSHNQFLQTLIQYGIIGLFFLFLSFILPMIMAIRNKNYLGLFWLFLFSTTAITESVFTRQWGVFSFAFFTSLFLLYSNKEKQISNT